ncbi:ATP-binding cassette domain-containing protein [Streptomyces sp. Ncost-T10-10d]|uniref:ATP-binding cassette domain-containing protein n=1 Tax=Streptomyces sp. Ncost-T10-10d TaxID=1839774 RepID=UPI00081EA8CE|nr:ATP-binding cassette domain-containing protein [Streptomyces sp. Ncost-T10-10d]SCF95323.1 ABC transporter [Streptomyces sp. Ncost-T10-10d]
MARPTASDHDLLGAIVSLGFEDLLTALPQGLDTPLGERGAGLSSGRSQQLALVRALLRDAPLMCLDEPTARLDPEAEARVLSAGPRPYGPARHPQSGTAAAGGPGHHTEARESPMNGSGAWRLLRMAAPRRALLTGTLLAIAAELGGAALLGVSGRF